MVCFILDESQPKTEDVKDVPSRSMAGDEAVPQERPAASVKKLPEVLRQEAVPSTGESAVAALPQDDVVRGQLIYFPYMWVCGI